ncbi:MAG TPA: EAL domain-containing protein [Frankiaceae bacterium]|jgi:PAS domain S-box-containing protein|nr:EAL domain-containing protein [Frankiaceae bacterium]
MTDDTAARLAAIVRASQDAIFEVDAAGRITTWNPGAERLLGYPEREALGLPLTALVPVDRLHETDWTLGAAREGLVPDPYETVRIARDGTLVPVSLAVSPVRDGGVASAAVVARDLRPLAMREARFRALVERAGELYAICTPDGVITYASPRDRTHGGREPTSLVGMNVLDLVREEDRTVTRAALASFSAVPGPHEPVTVRGVDAFGGDRWYRVIVTNLVDDPAVAGLVVAISDVTRERMVEEELALYAREDRLTGLPTRSSLPDSLRALRERDPHVAAVLVEVDVEGPRRTAGHLATEDVHRVLADRLREVAADGDVVARLSADTYCVLRAGVGEAAARRLAREVVSAVSEPVEARGVPWTLPATAGVTVSDTADVEEMLRDADVARYEAKAYGPGHAETFTPALRDAVTRRIGLMGTLRKGLSPEALRLVYQPVVRLRDGTVAGAEALLRWQEEDDPATFLSAATATGLMPAVGSWVLRTACAAAATWPEGTYVSVNVSARELESPAFARTLADALDTTGLDPRRLVLEVADPRGLREPYDVAAEVARLGARIALDRFGTGHGSLLYLRRLPVSMVKVSRELVGGLCVDDEDEAIVASVLNLAAAVGVEVTAVGVETEDQRAQLASLGCEVAQGFLLGRPGPAPGARGAPRRDQAQARRAVARARRRRAHPVADAGGRVVAHDRRSAQRGAPRPPEGTALAPDRRGPGHRDRAGARRPEGAVERAVGGGGPFGPGRAWPERGASLASAGGLGGHASLRRFDHHEPWSAPLRAPKTVACQRCDQRPLPRHGGTDQ